MTRTVLAVLLLSATSAWAEWTYVEGTDDFDAYVDLATIRKKGNVVKTWTLREYGAVKKIRGRIFLSTKAQEEFDCSEERFRVLYMAWFSRATGAGDVVGAFAEPTKWEPVAPGSLGEALFKIVCPR